MTQLVLEECALTVSRFPARFLGKALVLCIVISGVACAFGQARSTATETSRLSVFGGANGTFTGLESGRTTGITAGVDVSFRRFFTLLPSVELRGTLPLIKGKVDSQKNVLAGVQIAKPLGPLRPYADVLFGRGQIDYHGGFPDPRGQFTYFRTVSNVIAVGGGVDLDLTPHFALKADVQYQRYDTPVTVSGNLYSKALLGAIVYRFDFNHSPRNLR